MERDLEIIAGIYRAYARKDLKSVLLSLSDSVEVIQSPELPWGGHYVGHEGIQKFLASLSHHIESKVVLERLIDSGNQIVAVGQTVGKAKATNLEFEVPMVHVWSFHEGAVVRFEAYIDNATMLAALQG
jgi:ketosteroid isomerase-like protein